MLVHHKEKLLALVGFLLSTAIVCWITPEMTRAMFAILSVSIIVASCYYAIITGFKKFSKTVITDVSMHIDSNVQNVIRRVDDRTNAAIDRLGDTVSNRVDEVKEKLLGVSSDVLSIEMLLHNWKTHVVGLGLCAESCAKAEDVTTAAKEVVKIASMLGIESAIVRGIMGALISTGNVPNPQVSEQLRQHGFEDFEKYIPMVGTVAAIGGLEFGEINIGNVMAKSANNLKAMEILTKHLRTVLEAAGFVKPPNWNLISEINNQVTELKKDMMWIVETLHLNGADFCKPASERRVMDYSDRVNALSERIRAIKIPEIRNNQIITEANNIVMKSMDYLVQIKVIKSTFGARVEPVGVCIFGESQIGKTQMVHDICERVKEKLSSFPELFGESRHWTRWDANQRDGFDTGYCGQEIVYMDDAFQDKKCEDHAMWFTYISSSAVGTVQAEVNQKGLPFRALLCITSANQLPTQSITVNDVGALQNRFKITVHAEKTRELEVDPQTGRTVWDSNFGHLKLRIAPMKEWARELQQPNLEEVTLSSVIDRIASDMVANMLFFNQRMQSLNTRQVVRSTPEPVQQHADEPLPEHSEEEIQQIADDLRLIAETTEMEERQAREAMERGQPPSAPTQPAQDGSLTLMQMLMRDRAGQIRDLGFEVDDNLTRLRMPNPRYYGTENTQMDAELVMTNIAQNIRSAIMRRNPNTINHVTRWTRYLYQEVEDEENPGNTIRVTFDPNRFSGEHGLYDFLSTLGMWKIQAGHFYNFYNAYVRQGILLVESDMEDRYFWGPTFEGGTCFYLDSDDLRRQILNRLGNYRIMDNLNDVLTDFLSWRYNGLIGVDIIVLDRIRIEAREMFSQIPFEYYGWLINGYVITASYVNTARANTSAFTSKVYDKIKEYVQKGFAYFESIKQRLMDGAVQILTTILEFFGVDVEPLWAQISNLYNEYCTERVMIRIVAGILLFAVAKVVQICYFKKTDKIKQRGNHYNPNEKRVKTDRRQLRMKGFRERSFDECESDCEDEDKEFEVDSKLYFKLGPRKTAGSFYDSNWIETLCTDQDSSERAMTYEITVGKNTHIVVSAEETDDFKVEKNRFVSATRKKHDWNAYAAELIFETVGTIDENVDQFEKWINQYKSLNVADWQGEVAIKKRKDIYCIRYNLLALNSIIQGKIQGYTKKVLSNLKTIGERTSGIKESKNIDVKTLFDDNIEQHGVENSITILESIKNNHLVYISRVKYGQFDDLNNFGYSTHGLGHKDLIIFNAHSMREREIIRFWRIERPKTGDRYSLAVIIACDYVRDIAMARILSKDDARELLIREGHIENFVHASSMTDRFRDITGHLCDKELWQQLVENQTGVCYLPKTKITAIGRMKVNPRKTYTIVNSNSTEEREYIHIVGLELNLELPQPGDCGGPIVTGKNRYMCKLVGFHSGGSEKFWTASFLTKEDLDCITQHGYNDPWQELIVPGLPVDLPTGPNVTFLGAYNESTKPAGEMRLDHWHYSPFSDQFEEQLQPGPLSAYDDRIEVDLPVNLVGKKSLLLTPNSVMCSDLPPMDQTVLNAILPQMIDEMTMKIGYIHKTPEATPSILHLALNGHPENQYCKNLELNKSCGVPWNLIPGCTKKSDFLTLKENQVVFRDDGNGDRLKRRVKTKLDLAKGGERVISFSNSKLKDAVIKLSAVKAGKTRVFHCIPVDKIIFDSALFGNFKEAYLKAFIGLNHAVGVNPNSKAWEAIYNHINAHPNVFDMDFSNYDKHLHGELMSMVFTIIREVIQRKAPDGWDLARQVCASESINTYVIDYSTIYRTTRGNKSGEYLTTVVNCIANDILSFYTWIKTTGNYSLSDFRDNVSLVTFGDDKLESVSDEYAEKYNYFTAKVVMESIGHIITPGAKDGIERKFCDILSAQFLKRGFAEWEGMIVAPLLKRSIESPFVWTTIELSEFSIWLELVRSQLLEAVVYGKEYYNEFREKLMKCQSNELVSHLASLLSTTYDDMVAKYRSVYYGDE